MEGLRDTMGCQWRSVKQQTGKKNETVPVFIRAGLVRSVSASRRERTRRVGEPEQKQINP